MSKPRTVRRDIGGQPYTLVRVDPETWRVTNATTPTNRFARSHIVRTTPLGAPLKCSCPHCFHKGAWCKHLRAVEELYYEDNPTVGERFLSESLRAGFRADELLRAAGRDALEALGQYAATDPSTDAQAEADVRRIAAGYRLPFSAVLEEATRQLPSRFPPPAALTPPDDEPPADWYDARATEAGYDKLAGGWVGTEREPYPPAAEDGTEYGYYKQSANHR